MMRLTLSALAIVAYAASVEAQARPGRVEANCTYQTCALGLAPVWDGLAIVRGDSEARVGTLGFFVPGDVSRIFEGDADAVDAAREAVRVRQIAAVLTDAGLVLAATGGARALFQREWDGLSTALTLGGAASLVAGIPFQFAADGYLSRAVWLFNRRFAR